MMRIVVSYNLIELLLVLVIDTEKIEPGAHTAPKGVEYCFGPNER